MPTTNTATDDAPPPDPPTDATVLVTPRSSAGNRTIFHVSEDCRYVRDADRMNPWSRATAEAWGYRPCRTCGGDS